ncbi:hypothetical protein [Syntrophotalea carbinolica]|uniref:hypothetical protein n=1 Tax=Syntrophotalea carbinolica TaxID=19 RepID=UPI0002E6DBD2|nr:hypothetical protein [Syntrophotalea carbinolica]
MSAADSCPVACRATPCETPDCETAQVFKIASSVTVFPMQREQPSANEIDAPALSAAKHVDAASFGGRRHDNDFFL